VNLAAGGPLRGQIVVFTGGLGQLTRKQARERVEALGGRVAEAVSGNTNLVVVGRAPGAKLARAKRLKVPVLDQATFHRRLAKWERAAR
jgi:DNA ligase (NAD+)